MKVIASLKPAALLMVFVLAVSGCASNPDQPPSRDLRFSHLGPLTLSVAGYAVTSEYRAPLTDPNLDHEIEPTPTKVLANWAYDRLTARGHALQAKFIVEEGSIKRETLKTDKGVAGFFKNEQAERFVLILAARLDIVDQQGKRVGTAKATIERFHTVPEDVTLNDRDQVLFDMLEAGMKDFNAEMTRQMEAHLGRWLQG